MRPNTWISTKADGFSGSSKAPSTTVFGRKSPGTDVHMCIGRMTPADSAHIQSKLGYEWMTSLTCSLLVPFPPYVSSFSSLLWGGPDVKVGKEPNTLSKTICAIKNHKIPQRLLIKCPTSWREIKLQEAMLKERGIRIIANQDNKKDTSSISVIGSAFLFFSFYFLAEDNSSYWSHSYCHCWIHSFTVKHKRPADASLLDRGDLFCWLKWLKSLFSQVSLGIWVWCLTRVPASF